MDLLIAIGYLVVGFAFLIYCADSLVQSSVSIAYKFNINPAFVGLTLIAAGTSAPEIATSLMAAYKGNGAIAIGNVYGSNIFNMMTILGIAALFGLKDIAKDLIKIELPLLGLITIYMIYVMSDYSLEPDESYIFMALLMGFILFAGYRAVKSDAADDLEDEVEVIQSSLKMTLMFLVGLFGIGFGAHLALNGGVSLGRIFGLSERIIGLTIISVGTGLPELAASAVAAYRGQKSIAFTNVLGSNIINTLGIPAVTALFGPVAIQKEILSHDARYLLGFTLLLFPLVLINKFSIPKWQGALFILAYVYYLSSLL